MGRYRQGPRSTWAEINMGRSRWAEIDVGRDRPDSNSPVKNMASAACGASKLQQMLKVLAGRPGFDRAVRQVSRRYPVVADTIICAKVTLNNCKVALFK